MNIFKPFVLLFLCGLSIVETRAEIPKDLQRKILKSIEQYKDYSITYTRAFKYPNEKDTLIESYHSSVQTLETDNYQGWHRIDYTRSGTPRSLAACNGQEALRLNYKNNYYGNYILV